MIVPMIRITELARDAFGNGAELWIDRATPVFGGKAPADMPGTEAGAGAAEMFIGFRPVYQCLSPCRIGGEAKSRSVAS